MSCDRNGRRCSSAARRNGISGYLSRYLNTLTNWQTYGDMGNIEDIPQRVLDVTGRFFGLDGRIKGIFGVLIATHLAEQITGAVATMAVRMALRGRPFGRYRGITLRESPISPRAGRAQARLLGSSRVLESKGFYFHESGRTWHCNSTTYRVGDTPKTLTHIQSLSIPNREYFFDRELQPQDVIDLVLGDRDPDTIPGYIGSCNEIDGVLGFTQGIKRLLYVGNWLLVDEGERDAGEELVDYGDLGRGPGGQPPPGWTSSSSGPSGSGPAGGYGGYRSPTFRAAHPGSTTRAGEPQGEAYTRSGPDWGDTYRRYGPQGYASDVQPIDDDYRVDPGGFVGNLWDTGDNGRPRQTISIGGREVPLSIRGIRTTPDGRRLADAWYYRNNQWWPIKSERTREAIAMDVAQGVLIADAELELWA
jgi:hypothetical protein